MIGFCFQFSFFWNVGSHGNVAVALGLGVQLKVRGQPPYFLLLGFMYMVSCFLKTLLRFIKTCYVRFVRCSFVPCDLCCLSC